MPERKTITGVVNVLYKADGSIFSVLQSGDRRVDKVATKMVKSSTFAETEEAVKEYPEGQALQEGLGLSSDCGWKVLNHSPGKQITLEITVREVIKSCTAAHIREVYSREIEKEVRGLVKDVETTLAKQGVPA